MIIIKNNKILKPILKYPGGKTKEFPLIAKHIPQSFQDYYEPFIGGGSTWLNLSANHYYINDFSEDLMNLYKLIQQQDHRFIRIVENIINAWKMPYINDIVARDPKVLIKSSLAITKFEQAVLPYLYQDLSFIIPERKIIAKQLHKSVSIKVKSIQRKQAQYEQVTDLDTNAITAVKSAIYTLFRRVYNQTKNRTIHTATYWYLREYAYSSMFRFNKSGGFNVPYGGASYNHKSLFPKLKEATSDAFQDKLQATQLFNMDFYQALQQATPTANDFIFLDPPYDTNFSNYDQNSFGKAKQIELANYLKNEVCAKFMLIIKSSPLINSLYKDNESVLGGDKHLHILKFDKHYQVSFQGRNNQDVNHLLITNY